MQTAFTEQQLADPDTANAAGVIRKCVHCGFCTATCPTYLLLGDELDSPRGRIYLIKDMLENQRAPTPEVVTHIDRCLSCLSCQTTCPSGVNYMQLVDHARAYIEQRYDRPWPDRVFRALLAAILPYPNRFRAALALAPLGRPFLGMLGRTEALRPLRAMLELAGRARSSPTGEGGPRSGGGASPPRGRPTEAPAVASRQLSQGGSIKGRVVILEGCAEPVLDPEIRAATVRLLTRAGFEVVRAPGEACCGAIVHHMGREARALAFARANVDAWTRQIERGLTAIVVTASGCGTTLKNYGFMLRHDPAYADKAARVSALARDITELLAEAGLPPRALEPGLTVAYHGACSLQHGQRVTAAPKALLAEAGFTVREPRDAHLCCGSAGTYNILQSEIAGRLGQAKAGALAAVKPDVICAGNIGCLVQIAGSTGIPIVHTAQLLDWATGGPKPAGLTAS
ncbi:MAG TPA: heterodisulfide reductase-related iron-sulfur binding cluster [Caulobacteraceae bacterium]|jgi:glycolate oxidase iron-sulfur subunit|nr:heterodisulfide reductase-related iron-sulfur binding cluster [Caulobacteraceae bacterium]